MNEEESPVRVLLADDHYFVRVGLATSIGREPGLDVVAQAESKEEAIEIAASCQPDVAIIDMQLGDGTGAEVIAALKEKSPQTRCLILSVSTSEHDVRRAADAGAAGYLSKSADREELIDAVNSLAAGETYFPSAIYRTLQSSKARPSLSQREEEVLQLLARGQRNKEIAHSLGLAELTVKQHVSSILHKLDVQDRTQAAMAAVERGLVSLD
ncbi:MAG: response regulator [Opitutales bacterium]